MNLAGRRVRDSFRAKVEQLERFERHDFEGQVQNLAVTVMCVPESLYKAGLDRNLRADLGYGAQALCRSESGTT
jgi:hypothetical protein